MDTGGNLMTRIDHQTLGEWQRSLASSSPTPGGGAAAAVALGQGAALGLMVCDLTLSNERYSNGWPAAEAFSETAVPVLFSSLELASKDVVAYDAVVDAMALPKDTEEDRATRSDRLREATRGAAEVPKEIADHAARLLEHMVALAQGCNPNTISDLGVACLLLSSAAKGGIFNVRINTRSLDASWATDLEEACSAMMERIRSDARAVMDVVHASLERPDESS